MGMARSINRYAGATMPGSCSFSSQACLRVRFSRVFQSLSTYRRRSPLWPRRNSLSAVGRILSAHPYEKKPIPFDQVAKELGRLGFDGIEIGAFRPHIYPDDYPLAKERAGIRQMLKDAGLKVSGLAADFWGLSEGGEPCPPGVKGNEQRYVNVFKKNLQLCLDLGSPAIRVDTVEGPDAYTTASKRTAVMKQIAKVWRECAEIAAECRVRVTWEFEPGFIFNKPSEVLKMVNGVCHDNFGVLFDTCHAYMCSVVGARQVGKKETLKGGVV
ncbi:MAG TPA: sugar phosphate isomerase/epimerase, partial [Desulfobacterales bacterium]|nr:sugar phosphate isomerase/epimerase [Desulfobacterales bacterium]